MDKEGLKAYYKPPKVDAMSFIFFTPLSCICMICKKTMNHKWRSIREHMQNKHSEIQILEAPRNIASIISSRVDTCSSIPISSFFRDKHATSKKWQCSGCGLIFRDKFNTQKHIEARHKPNSEGKEAVPILTNAVQLICGKWLPYHGHEQQSLGTNDGLTPSMSVTCHRSLAHAYGKCSFRPDECMPASACIEKKEIERRCQPLVHDDDDIGSWPAVMRLSLTSENFCDNAVRAIVATYCATKEPDDTLRRLMECSDYYFDMCSSIIPILPGDIRRDLQTLAPLEEEDKCTSRIFNERRSYKSIKQYSRHLLSYLTIEQCTMISTYKSWTHSSDYSVKEAYLRGLIPSLFYDLVREEVAEGSATVVVKHAHLFIMRLESGSAKLLECGNAGQHLSTVLHALRAALAGKSALYGSISPQHKSSYVTKLQSESTAIHQLCPMIAKLRRQYSEKPSSKNIIVDEQENIIINGVPFRSCVWKNLVPILFSQITEELDHFFPEKEHRAFLELENEVTITNWKKAHAELFQRRIDEASPLEVMQLHLIPLVMNRDAQRLCALIEFCLLGMGVGAGRLTELFDLTMNRTHWFQGDLFYTLVSKKVGSVTARGGSVTEFMLPRCISRCILVARYIFVAQYKDNLMETNRLLPCINVRHYQMIDATKVIFSIRNTTIDVTYVRQFFTSLLNILYPHGHCNFGVVVSTDKITSRSNHSSVTAKKHYSTSIDRSNFELWRHYHQLIGDSSYTLAGARVTVHKSPLREGDALAVVQELYGPQANFRNDAQEIAVKKILSNRGKHMVVIMPCGGGKTMLVIANCILSHIRGNRGRSIIFITPHVGLLAHHMKEIQDLLDKVSLNKFWVEGFSGSQLNKSVFPRSLQGEVLPDVIGLTICSFKSLLVDHLEVAKGWATRLALEGIVLDEAQLIGSESSFRSEYDSLPLTPAIGVPVTILTGSLTSPVALDFAEYMNLLNQEDSSSFNIVSGGDLVGNHFNFEVIQSNGVFHSAVARYSMKRAQECAVHIICASKTIAKKVYEEIIEEELPLTSMLLTGDSSDHEKKCGGREWTTGSIQIMVSTTCFLFGNQNLRCRHIVLADIVHDLSNMLQAMMRLRIEQGGNESFVTQFLSSIPYCSTYQKLNDEKTLSNLYAGGKLKKTPRALSRQYFTRGAYVDFLLSNGCLMANLSKIFGYNRSVPCFRCTNCNTELSCWKFSYMFGFTPIFLNGGDS